MVSLGLAWSQGQKNAMENARGKTQTVSGMMKDIKEMKETADWLSPEEEKVRSYNREQQGKQVDSYRVFEKYRDKMTKDPKALADYFSEVTGDKWDYKEDKDGRITMRSESGQVKQFDTLSQAVDHARQSFLTTTPGMTAELKARADQERAAIMELNKLNQQYLLKVKEYKETKEPIERMKLEAQLRIAQAKLGAAAAALKQRAQAARLQYLGSMAGHQPKLSEMDMQAIGNKMGFRYDATEKQWQQPIKSADGKNTSWSALTPENQLKFAKAVDNYTTNNMLGAANEMPWGLGGRKFLDSLLPGVTPDNPNRVFGMHDAARGFGLADSAAGLTDAGILKGMAPTADRSGGLFKEEEDSDTSPSGLEMMGEDYLDSVLFGY